MLRTKRYRKLKELYAKAKKDENEKLCKHYASQMNDMQKQYNVTWDYCRTQMISIYKKYGLIAIFGTTQAEDVWKGVEKVLYGNGKTLHFHKRGDLPILRAKETVRGIILSVQNGELWFKYNGIEKQIQPKDNWEHNEIDAIIHYMENKSDMDKKAVDLFNETGKLNRLFGSYCSCFIGPGCLAF